MNHCRDCNSDYAASGTCNCFAPGGKRCAAPAPLPWAPAIPWRVYPYTPWVPSYPNWYEDSTTIIVGDLSTSGVTITGCSSPELTSGFVSLEHAMAGSCGVGYTSAPPS